MQWVSKYSDCTTAVILQIQGESLCIHFMGAVNVQVNLMAGSVISKMCKCSDHRGAVIVQVT